jgi:hypothetical protein
MEVNKQEGRRFSEKAAAGLNFSAVFMSLICLWRILSMTARVCDSTAEPWK